MLITFHCKAYADITMFGDVAKRLLRLMGHSGTVPSAILAEDVPDALERLKAGIAAAGPQTGADSPLPEGAGNGDEPPISLATRAYPLIKLLEAAVAQECDVMWDSN